MDGRPAKAWFRSCKQQWQVLRAAIRRGDTHAAAAARKLFNAAKRRAKRHCEKQWQARLWDDFRHNPRRFWTAYRGKRMACMLTNLRDVDRHWRLLFGTSGQRSLPECGDSVASFVDSVMSAAPGSARSAAAAELNQCITCDEVQAALRRVKMGRMAGPDGLQTELFKGAYHIVSTNSGRLWHDYFLAEDLCRLFNTAFVTGQQPPHWAAAILCAVFKKGDPADLDNYRGIAVGSVLGKLYSMILESRLNEFCERQGIRAKGQAGFRRSRRCSDHVFVLRHLIDRVRSRPGQHLFACFVDFRKAYDTVRRDLLMQCLADIGLHDHMLRAICSIYWQPTMITKVGSQYGHPFVCTRGVKQGDPLSPLLFGIFFDRIERWFEQRAQQLGVPLGPDLVRLLLYADDLVLLANSRLELQLMMKILADFCDEYDMTVNVDKTEVVVFGRSRFTEANGESPTVFLRNREGVRQQLPVVSEFRYLGVVFHETKGVGACVEALAAAGRRAMWAILSRCKAFGITSLSMKVRLFDTLVAPVMGYCSEIWAPALLAAGASVDSMLGLIEQMKIQMLFLRTIAGKIRSSTSRHLLLREFGCQPVVQQWFVSTVRLWNRCVLRGTEVSEGRQPHGGDWMVLAMKQNLTLAAQAADARVGRPFWCQQFKDVLDKVHAATNMMTSAVVTVEGAMASGTLQGSDCIELGAAGRAFEVYLNSCWSQLPADPRLASSQKILCSTYENWFAAAPFAELDRGRPASWCSEFHRMGGLSWAHVCSLLRFRLSAHNLRIATGRFQGLTRSDRICQWCGQVDDEFHLVFECPTVQEVRVRFADLFVDFGGCESLSGVSRVGRQMARFMNQDPVRVGAFVHECLDIHDGCNMDDFPPTPVLSEVDSDEVTDADLLNLVEFFSVSESLDEFFSATDDGGSIVSEVLFPLGGDEVDDEVMLFAP